MQKIFIILFCLIPVLIVGQESEKKNHFEVGLGLVISPEYNDVISNAYSDYDISGGWGLIKIDFGYAFSLNENIQLIPRARLLGGRVSTVTKGFEYAPNKKANIFALLGFSGRYLFDISSQHFYGNIDAYYDWPFSDVSRLEFKSNGIAFGFGIGYLFSDRSELELGNLILPITYKKTYSGDSNANFGGFYLTYRGTFTK